MKPKFKLILFSIFILIIPVMNSSPSEEGLSIRRFAIFVGSNYGGINRVKLEYATSDATAMADIMKEMGGIDISDRIILLDPTSKNLEESFGTIKDKITLSKLEARRTEFLLYYSGHSDENGLLLGETSFSYPALRQKIQNIEADVNIAILDSCSSGAFTRLKGGTRRSPFLIDDSATMKGHAFLTSSSADEAAQESDKIGASFFTHYLISGLRGAADNTGDGKITLNEAYKYAFDETLARTINTQAGPQHPSYDIQLTGAGDLVLTDLRTSSAAILLSEELSGRLFMRDSFGKLVAEVQKIAGIPIALALPPGSYKMTLNKGENLYEASITLLDGKKIAIYQKDFNFQLKESTRIRGEQETAESSSRDNFIHEYANVSFLPNAGDPERKIVHYFSLSFFGNVYRIDGVEVGFISMATEDVRGAQITSIFSKAGKDVKGVQASSIYSHAGRDVSGAQLSGVFNIAGRALFGLQAAGTFNITHGSVSYFQTSGVFNIAGGDFKGLQNGGVFNINGKNFYGAQTSGVFNINSNNFYGFQGAGVFNINNNSFKGVQAAGIFNKTGSINGAQLSIVNISSAVAGAQVGLVNIAGDVKGTQLGLININRSIAGLPVGLINISKDGLYHLQGWYDQESFAHVGFQFGTKRFYTLVFLGTPFKPLPETLLSGIGFGIHFGGDPMYIDIDLSAKHIAAGNISNTNAPDFLMLQSLGLYPYIRGVLGLSLFKVLGVFGGLSLDTQILGITREPVTFTGTPTTVHIWQTQIDFYTKWFIGVRL
ncbi:MAG: caspase family protein [Spirochaetota bacterium]